MNRHLSTSISNSTGQGLRSVDLSLNRPLQMRGAGIMRNRINRPMDDPAIETNPKTDELIAKFFATHGIPFDNIHDRTFRDLVQHLNPKTVIPMPKVLEASMERLGSAGKPVVNYAKTVGPLSVTIDITGNEDKKYLCFSIHYFEDLHQRKNVVYLRKMTLNVIDKESLLTTIRRAVNTYSYANIKFTNIVCSNQDFYDLLVPSEVVKRGFLCFHYSMTKFVEDLFQIKELAEGFKTLENFVRYVKKNPELYTKFRREQLTKSCSLDLPSISNGKWDQKVMFLTRCLILHEAFILFSARCNLKTYIAHDKFTELVFFQRVLQQCVKYSRDLSLPHSSISQVNPAIMSMRNFLTTHTMSYPFEKNIRDAFTRNFQRHTNDFLSGRYDTAALLDPRFAYRENVYATGFWNDVERKLVEDFSLTEPTGERSFHMDTSAIPYEDRKSMINTEFERYRQAFILDRPEENHNPFDWWSSRHQDLPILGALAREFLACPAVAIDSKYYFANGGKLKHFCETYDYSLLELSLSVAGTNQKFHGRGAAIDVIPPEMIESLNHVAYRRHKEVSLRRAPNARYFHPDPLWQCSSQIPPKRSRIEEMDPQGELEKVSVDAAKSTEEIKQEFDFDLGPDVQSPEEIKQELEDPGYETANNMQPSDQNTAVEEKPTSLLDSHPPTIVSEVKIEIDDTIVLKPPVVNVPAPKPRIIATPRPVMISGKRPITHGASTTVTSSMPKQPGILSKPLHPRPMITAIRRMIPIGKQLPTPPSQYQPLMTKITKPLFGKPLTPMSSAENDSPPVLMPQVQRPSAPQTINQHKSSQKIIQNQTFVRKISPSSQNGQPGTSSNPIRYTVVTPKATVTNAGVFPLKEPKLEPPLILGFKAGPLDLDINDYDGGLYSEALDMGSTNLLNSQVDWYNRKPCNRNCSCCGKLVTHSLLKNVTIESEKLMVILGAVYRKEMSVMKAQSLLARPAKTYMCRAHFTEAVAEIFKMLRVSRPDDIATVSLDLINNAIISVHSIYNRTITSQQIRQQFINFTDKYFEATTEAFGANRLNFDRDPSPSDQNDFDDQEILPKSIRQPRKQVLEHDQHDATVKVIEQEDFRLPQVAPSENDEDCENPEECCFCLIRADVRTMLRVPKSDDRLARWIHKIGPEFAQRIKTDKTETNWICRSHFPENAFSSRGRLRRGELPIAQPKKVETSYSFDTEGCFTKVEIQKSGTQKDSSIDLASKCIKRRSSVWSEKDYDYEDYEEGYYQEESSDSDYSDDNQPGPSSKIYRPRRVTRSLSRSATPKVEEPSEDYDGETSSGSSSLSGDKVQNAKAPVIAPLPIVKTPLIPKLPAAEIPVIPKLPPLKRPVIAPLPKLKAPVIPKLADSGVHVDPKEGSTSSTKASPVSSSSELVAPKEEDVPLRTSGRIRVKSAKYANE